MLFDSSVRKEMARGFSATLVVILTIVLTMMLIRTLGMAANGSVAPQDVVMLLGYTALGQLPTILALSLFVAVVVSLGRMYRDSEMAIWFSSGVGLSRFVAPIMQTCWPVLLVIALLVLFAWPWGNQQAAELRARYAQRSDLLRVAPGTFETSSDGSRVFFVEAAGTQRDIGRNVFVLTRQADREAVTTAKSGHIEIDGNDRFLVLESGHRNETDFKTGVHSRMRFDTYRLLVDEHAARTAQERSPNATDTIDLITEPTLRGKGELAWRLSLVLGAGNLLILGIGSAATNPRRANNWNLLFALLTFVVYYNFINLSQAWVASGRLGIGMALILIHGSAFIVAMALLWWRDHAAVFTWGNWFTRKAMA
jgi:lipopolysaccharide export system permease protein